MFGKSGKTRLRLGLISVAGSLILTMACGILVLSGTAVAKKGGSGKGGGGGGGNDPVSVRFEDLPGDGLQSDWPDWPDAIPGQNPYCDMNKEKIQVEIASEGYLNLYLDSKRRVDRTLFVDFGEVITLQGWGLPIRTTEDLPDNIQRRVEVLRVGMFRDDFDMRSMAIGEARNDINVCLSLWHGNPDEGSRTTLYIRFDPSWAEAVEGTAWGTVRRADPETWEIEVRAGSAATLLETYQDPAGAGMEFNHGLVYVSPFKATVTLK